VTYSNMHHEMVFKSKQSFYNTWNSTDVASRDYLLEKHD
jgi:hypothetical protein